MCYLFQIKCFAFHPSAGTLTVEQIYQDRDQFAKLVREVAAPDVGRMGIEILSFTIKVHPRLVQRYGAPGSAVEAAQQSLALAPLLQLAERLQLTACPSPPGVSMTAATACPVSRQLGKEPPVSCRCKQLSLWRELTDNRASGESEGRCRESPPLLVSPVSAWQQADMALSDPGLTTQMVTLSFSGKGTRWS